MLTPEYQMWKDKHDREEEQHLEYLKSIRMDLELTRKRIRYMAEQEEARAALRQERLNRPWWKKLWEAW